MNCSTAVSPTLLSGPPQREFGRALLWFAVLGFAVLIPSGLFQSGVVPGDPESDIYTHLWVLDWMRTGLTEDGRIPLWTDTINYPTGGRFVASDLINTLVSVPLSAAFGIVRSYGIVLWLNLVFSGIAFFLLVRYLTASAWAGVVAGTAYLLMPYTISYGVCSGVPEVNTAGVFPLLLYFALRTVREPSWRNPLLAALAGVLLALNAFHATVMVSIAFVVLVIYAILFVRDPDADLSLAPPGGVPARTPWRSAAKLTRLAVAAALCLAVSVPYLAFVRRTIAGEDSHIPHEALAERFNPAVELYLDNYRPGTKVPYFTPLTDFLVPGKGRSITMDEITRFYHAAYLGIVIVALAVVGLTCGGRFGRALAFLAVLAALLASGPYLVLTRGWGLGEPANPVFLLFYYGYPMFRLMMEPLRFAWLAGVAVYLLAGAGAAAFLRGPRRHVVGVALTAAVALDLIVLSPVPWPIPKARVDPSPAAARLAADPREFAVLELPVWVRGTAMMPRRHFVRQIEHGKAIADNISGHVAPYLLKNDLTSRLLRIEAPDRYPEFPEPDPAGATAGLAQLYADGFRYIVLTPGDYTPDALASTQALLGGVVGKPMETADGLFLYALRAPEDGRS